MKLGKIFRYEFRYQLGHVSTWLFLAVLLVLPFGLVKISTPADGTYQNAPSAIAFFTVASGVIWLLMAGAITGDAAARDVQTRMHPLLYATPVSRAAYLGGRFMAALALNALLLLAVQVSLMLAFYTPGGKEVAMGPFRPEAYLSAYAFLAVPVVLVGTAVQFTLAVLSGRAIASYVGSVLLFFTSHFFVLILAHLLGNWELTKLLDLLGLGSIISDELETWTPLEANTRLVLLQGPLLWNRLIWLGVAGGLLAFTYYRFQAAQPTLSPWWRRLARRHGAGAQAPAVPKPTASSPTVVPQVVRSFGLATNAYQTLAVVWASFGKIVRSPAGLSLVALFAAGSAVFGSQIMQHSTIPLLPTTQQVIDYLANTVSNVKSPWLIIPLLLMYYAGELVWREREAGLSEIADAAPVPEGVLLLGKFLGLALMLVLWMGLLTLGGIVLQAGLGYHEFEVGLYLRALFGLQLLEYLLFALLALVVHALVNQKYVGHLVLLLVLGFMAFAARLGLHHHLFVFGAAPGWTYTDMRGFGASLGPWLWFKGYWAAWALLLAVAARLYWPRGKEQGLGSRMHLARRRLTRPTAVTAAVALGGILALGGFIFYNTNVLNEYRATTYSMERQAEYERRYARYANARQPKLVSTKLNVELYPERQAVVAKAVYRLVNHSAVPIDTIHFAPALEVKTSAVDFGRPATPLLVDDVLGHRMYILLQPLQPGDSLLLRFQVHAQSRGFRNDGVQALVEPNGTYLMAQDLLPGIGYQLMRELRKAGLRKQYGLRSRPDIPSLADAQMRQHSSRGDWMDFDAVVGTASDQVAVAPGALRRTWTTGGRSYFHYVTDAPIQNQAAFFSAHYAVRNARWQDSTGLGKSVSIKLYYHPGHAANVERMVRSIRASLDYYTAQFGSYPYGHLTVVERAGNEGELNAEASTIDYGEQFALMKPDDGPKGFDLPYYVLAHEMAHQYGGLYAPVEGVQVLAEGLAVYSGMQVLEKTYGYGHLHRYLSFLQAAYEVPRSRAMAPLLRANSAFLGYRKAPLALYALSQYIGRQKVNGAIRQLIASHTSEKAPLATTLDFYRELKAVTPDSLHYLLHDLFETNTYWDLVTERATTQPTRDGRWQVTLDVQARKFVVDGAGAEQELPMNDWVEVGVFAPNQPAESGGQPLYRQKHRLRSGQQTIRVTVPGKPARAGIDPYLLLVDIKTDDNVKVVTPAP